MKIYQTVKDGIYHWAHAHESIVIITILGLLFGLAGLIGYVIGAVT